MGFALLCSAVFGLMVTVLVATNALLAQISFRVEDLSARVDGLSQRSLELTREAATMSAPDRIVAWASANCMRLPAQIHTLPVPSRSRAPVGGSDDSVRTDTSNLTLKTPTGTGP